MRSENKYPGIPKIILKNSRVCKLCSSLENDEVLKKVKSGKYTIESCYKLVAETKNKKSGIITLVGRSNVGKSTLLNTIIGTKISAVTDKPQTTRNVIHGVLNRPEGQAVFVDTPGIFKDHHNHLSGQLTDSVYEALKEIDVLIYVVDPTKPLGSEERSILATVRQQQKIPKILVINKSDLPEKEREFYQKMAETMPFNPRKLWASGHERSEPHCS